jgi:hypothetical protein
MRLDRRAHGMYGQCDRGLSSAGRYALLARCFREAGPRRAT